jgi:hypothetical protein
MGGIRVALMSQFRAKNRCLAAKKARLAFMLREDRIFVVMLILGSIVGTLLIVAVFSCMPRA